MSHKSKAEQISIKVRKDRHGKARVTLTHKNKTAYKRARNVLKEYENEITT